MICKLCGTRYAPFPKEDWDFTPVFFRDFPDKDGRLNGFYPKTDEAIRRREIVFNNDKKGYCGCESNY